MTSGSEPAGLKPCATGDASDTAALIDAYAAAPARLREAVVGLDDIELLHAPAAGKWSIKEIVVHLCDAEMIGAHRIMKAIAEPTPTLDAYDQEAFAAHLEYKRRDLRAALDTFEALRRTTADLLRKMPAGVWTRTAHHKELGPMTVRFLVAHYVEHSDNHLAQIENIRAMLAKPAASGDEGFDESLSDA